MSYKKLLEELSQKELRVLFSIEAAMLKNRTPTLSYLYRALPREYEEILDEITLKLRSMRLIHAKETKNDLRVWLSYKGYELLGFYNLYKRGIIEDLRGPVGEGKEAYVYRGIGDEIICVKIYRISQRKFRKVKRYRKVSQRFRVLISGEMAKREFYALEDLRPDVEVPKPIGFSRNLVAMEWFDGIRLFKASLEEPMEIFVRILNNIIEAAKKGYIHGDLSAYNVLYNGEEIRIIDRPQAIRVGEEGWKYYLYRDLKNLIERFNKEYKLGIDPSEAFDEVIKHIEADIDEGSS